MKQETATERKNRPMPEIFTRHDVRNSGGWDVNRAQAVRGEPFISVSEKVMRVPLDDSKLAQAIRAHEQIHVKVSPQDLTPYITDVTGEAAIRAAEEARINKIGDMLGFPMESLVTGSERFEGEQISEAGDWAAAVYAVAASVHTGSLKPFLTGIRRNAPEWGKPLREIANEIVKFQKNQIKVTKKHVDGTTTGALRRYGSTELQSHSDRIIGMNFTIELAMLLESIAAMPAPEPEATESEDSEAEGTAGPNVDNREVSTTNETQEMEENSGNKFDRSKIQSEAANLLKSLISRDGPGEWADIEVKRMPLPITIQGAIGRKRVAANVGRNPRRIQRLLTDPERRIFDKTVKASGGVVLIDCSGSMLLSREDLREMMNAAPGCTIIGYSYTSFNRGSGSDTFILGEKGKICDALPEFFYGNGNDLTALKYANSLRTRQAPVIWVTDGLVYYGKSHGAAALAELECASYAKANRIHMEFNPSAAVRYLTSLKNGAGYHPKLIERWEELTIIK